jgi:hypothetical protein
MSSTSSSTSFFTESTELYFLLHRLVHASNDNDEEMYNLTLSWLESSFPTIALLITERSVPKISPVLSTGPVPPTSSLPRPCQSQSQTRSLHRCPTCWRTFPTARLMKRHTRIHRALSQSKPPPFLMQSSESLSMRSPPIGSSYPTVTNAWEELLHTLRGVTDECDGGTESRRSQLHDVRCSRDMDITATTPEPRTSSNASSTSIVPALSVNAFPAFGSISKANWLYHTPALSRLPSSRRVTVTTASPLLPTAGTRSDANQCRQTAPTYRCQADAAAQATRIHLPQPRPTRHRQRRCGRQP